MTAAAVKQGALEFLEKPFPAERLVSRVEEEAVAESERRCAEQWREQTIRQRSARLTTREREVMALATEGLSNKEMANRLDVSPRTVENHRARVMEKMATDSIADLCHMALVCAETPARIKNPG